MPLKLTYLADRPRCAVPKYKIPTRLDEAEDDRLAEKKRGEKFRAKVWKRAKDHCEVCGRKCRHTLELAVDAGHVDHNRGRNVAPEDKFNPKKAKLKCGRCHLKKHGQRI